MTKSQIAAANSQKTSTMKPHIAEGVQRRAIFLSAERLTKNFLFFFRNVEGIKSTILRRNFSFFQDRKAANIQQYLKVLCCRKNGKEQVRWWILFLHRSSLSF
jgi:hypothetical protein